MILSTRKIMDIGHWISFFRIATPFITKMPTKILVKKHEFIFYNNRS